MRRDRADDPAPRRRALLVLLIAGLAIAAACTTPERRQPSPYDAPGVNVDPSDDGAVLYARDCAWCHGARGEGTTFGPNLNGELDGGAYTDFMLSTGRMPLASPDQPSQRREVHYTRAQIDAIVAVVGSFGGTGPPVPAPDPAAGRLSNGQVLYQENCAACHAMTAIGGALASGRIAPPLDHATPVQVAEAMLVGPGCSANDRACGAGSGAMPRFDLTREQIDDITRYVEYVRSLSSEGGWAIGRLGPVGEGAVGLLIGLGILLLVARWIGTTVEEDERA